MSAIPGNLDTDQQPPMTVPLRHFFVALGFLLAGVLVGLGMVAGAIPGLSTLAHVHLLLAGWVCVTIMGAMTQFVPVWSGTNLHSRRLANLQLALVTFGLTGFALAFVLGTFTWLVGFGAVILVGFWVFVYNVARTLPVGGYDVTERHFLLALLFFLSFTTLGVVLAAHLTRPVLSSVSVTHGGVLGAHVTFAVFGAVLTTIYGALYQLATMFTQTELHGVDKPLQRFEEVAHPAGVVLLAFGWLAGVPLAAQVGGLSILLAAIAVGCVLGRKLLEMRVERTPMHTRYAVVAVGLLTWAVLSIPAWITRPLERGVLLGGPGTTHLLVLGVVGFVVFGTLYHVVPFIIWVHEYSDRLGFERVPMVDDLYDERLAATDFGLLLAGTALLVASDLWFADVRLAGAGGVLVTLGVVVFVSNMVLVVCRHSSHSVDSLIFGVLSPRRTSTADRRLAAEHDEPSAVEHDEPSAVEQNS